MDLREKVAHIEPVVRSKLPEYFESTKKLLDYWLSNEGKLTTLEQLVSRLADDTRNQSSQLDELVKKSVLINTTSEEVKITKERLSQQSDEVASLKDSIGSACSRLLTIEGKMSLNSKTAAADSVAVSSQLTTLSNQVRQLEQKHSEVHQLMAQLDCSVEISKKDIAILYSTTSEAKRFGSAPINTTLSALPVSEVVVTHFEDTTTQQKYVTNKEEVRPISSSVTKLEEVQPTTVNSIIKEEVRSNDLNSTKLEEVETIPSIIIKKEEVLSIPAKLNSTKKEEVQPITLNSTKKEEVQPTTLNSTKKEKVQPTTLNLTKKEEVQSITLNLTKKEEVQSITLNSTKKEEVLPVPLDLIDPSVKDNDSSILSTSLLVEYSDIYNIREISDEIEDIKELDDMEELEAPLPLPPSLVPDASFSSDSFSDSQSEEEVDLRGTNMSPGSNVVKSAQVIHTYINNYIHKYIF